MKLEPAIQIIIRRIPAVQAIYLFGSFGTENERPDSDVDVALLLPFQHGHKMLHGFTLVDELADFFKRKVDLVSLRDVNTVFQKEIIMADRRIYCENLFAADEFEMLVISEYQKLNEERREIIQAGIDEGRFVV